MLILIYSDPYFYDLDFKIDQLIEKREIIFWTYYLIPFALGILVSFFLNFFIKENWFIHSAACLFGFLLFYFFDNDYYRRIWAIFENVRINVWIQFIIAVILVFLLLKVLLRVRLKKMDVD